MKIIVEILKKNYRELSSFERWITQINSGNLRWWFMVLCIVWCMYDIIILYYMMRIWWGELRNDIFWLCMMRCTDAWYSNSVFFPFIYVLSSFITIIYHYIYLPSSQSLKSISWGILHTDKFWKENAKYVEYDNFRELKTLLRLLHSTDPVCIIYY